MLRAKIILKLKKLGGNPTPRNNPSNPVLNVLANPDLDPSLSDSYFLDSSCSSDDEYYKQRQQTKNNKNQHQIKTRFNEPIKKCANLKADLLTVVYKSTVISFKLYEDTLQLRFYYLYFMNLLQIVLSISKETYILLMDCPSIRGVDFPYYYKKDTWNLLHAYIDAHSQILID